MKRNLLFFVFIIFAFGNISYAQVLGGGEVHGSFQTDAQYYNKDSVIGADEIPEKMAVNAFFELRYTNKNFEAGMRYELFMPQMQGYDPRWKGNGFGNRYLRYNGDKVDITVGNFYEQFGSGMILRSYQEWNLGFDNAFDGIRVKYKMKALTITGLIAKQRFYWDLGPGLVRGIDGQLSVNDLFNSMQNSTTRVFVGGSFVSRFQTDADPLFCLPENVGAYAGRFQIYHGKFNFKFEAGGKINDPNASNNMIYKNGNAVVAEFGYSTKGLGFNIQVDRSDNMDFRSDRTASGFDMSVGYIPAMTRQHAYSLAAMYPYASQANGQMGLQGTLFYKLKKKTWYGGRYGTSVDLNYSVSYAIDKQAPSDTSAIGVAGTYGYKSDFFKIGDEKYYHDFNIKLTRKLNKKWKASLMYMNVFYNMLINEGHNSPSVHANVYIADVWWKFKPYNSLHMEAQFLATKQDDGNWSSGMLEYNRRGFFVAGILLYNHGISNSHGTTEAALYPSLTTGYTHGSTRISMTYGKQREGIVCVGGVCRAVPASNGLSFTINSSF